MNYLTKMIRSYGNDQFFVPLNCIQQNAHANHHSEGETAQVTRRGRENYTCIREGLNSSTVFSIRVSREISHPVCRDSETACPSAPKKLPTSGKPRTVTRNESLLPFKVLIISVQWLFQLLKQCRNVPYIYRLSCFDFISKRTPCKILK